MEDELFQIVIDEMIHNAARRTAYKAIEAQSRVDSFITVSGQLMSEDDIANLATGAATSTALAAEYEAIRRQIIRELKDAMIETAQTARETRQKRDNPDGRYAWQVNSGNPCPDCSARDGQVASMEYWEAAGTPRSGVTLCKSKCKCALNLVP